MKPKFIYRSVDLFSFLGIDEKPEPSDFKYHTHLMCEIYYFVEGDAIFHVEGAQYPLKPGDILVMRPTEAHYVEVRSNHFYERFVINFSPDLLYSIDPETRLLDPFLKREAGTTNLYRNDDPDNSPYLPYIKAFQDSHGDRMTMIANLILLLNQISSTYNAVVQKSSKPTTLEAKVLAWIDTNLPRAVTLDELCARYGISRSQLLRRFKKATGTTIGKYISAKRLILAQQLIKEGNNPTEIYTSCGFQDYSSFYRSYLKYFGYSPKMEQYQSRIQNEDNHKYFID